MRLAEGEWILTVVDTLDRREVLKERLHTKNRQVAIGKTRRILRQKGYLNYLNRYETKLQKTIWVE